MKLYFKIIVTLFFFFLTLQCLIVETLKVNLTLSAVVKMVKLTTHK